MAQTVLGLVPVLGSLVLFLFVAAAGYIDIVTQRKDQEKFQVAGKPRDRVLVRPLSYATFCLKSWPSMLCLFGFVVFTIACGLTGFWQGQTIEELEVENAQPNLLIAYPVAAGASGISMLLGSGLSKVNMKCWYIFHVVTAMLLLIFSGLYGFHLHLVAAHIFGTDSAIFMTRQALCYIFVVSSFAFALPNGHYMKKGKLLEEYQKQREARLKELQPEETGASVAGASTGHGESTSGGESAAPPSGLLTEDDAWKCRLWIALQAIFQLIAGTCLCAFLATGFAEVTY